MNRKAQIIEISKLVPPEDHPKLFDLPDTVPLYRLKGWLKLDAAIDDALALMRAEITPGDCVYLRCHTKPDLTVAGYRAACEV